MNARLWFVLVLLALVVAWHEWRTSLFRQEQAALLRRLELGPDYASGDYILLRREIERLRAQPAPNYRLESLKQEVEADVARATDSLMAKPAPYSPAIKAAMADLVGRIRGGELVKARASTRAKEYRVDSLKAETLTGVMRWGHQQQRRNLLLTAGAAILALILVLGYRASWLPRGGPA